MFFSMTDAIEAELLQLKEDALAATRARDAEFYRQYLAEDAIAVLPFGVMGKEAIVRAVEHSAFQSTGLSDTRVVVLGPDAGVVTYHATFVRDGKSLTAFVTTVYQRRAGKWQGVLYQQSLLPPLGS